MSYYVAIVVGYEDMYICGREEFDFEELSEAEKFAEELRASLDKVIDYIWDFDEFEDEIIIDNPDLKSDRYSCWLAEYITDEPDQCIEAMWAEEEYICGFEILRTGEKRIITDWECVRNEYKD